MAGVRQIASAMTIAGSDSGAGAGVQADLKTFAALGVYGTLVLTAITAQNTLKVTQVLELPPDLIAAQIDAVMSDIGADAAKTGMLANSEIIGVVAERVRSLEIPNLVVDPAMGSGHFLVGAADFLSLRLTNDPHLEDVLFEEMGDEDPQAYYKRLIVERCLYGVDLNPLTVELAKLSLWLHTVSRNKALSFLDHHLRCGNSLVGARVEADLPFEPPRPDDRGRVHPPDREQRVLGFTETLTAKHLHYLLDTFRRIVELPTGDAEAEREKDHLYRVMDAVREGFRAVVVAWVDGINSRAGARQPQHVFQVNLVERRVAPAEQQRAALL
ncbi:MAG: bifunctional hydroxymethylpyrimidine kinase/phosphomethylpyrimidine kinase [Acidobacteria bacterium]|nr:bifunctional hydroxymethylpyrimidine kinase/phosphomethylpyrimidine kinase [Acidobacteriota bacterium]